LHAGLRQYLADPARTRPVLIVIDEAQNLEYSSLEVMRLLSDFETPDRKLLHIVLAGQEELADKLLRPELAQLRQRITMISRLESLRPAEVTGYLQHRLRVAGNPSGIFAESATRNIAILSQGIPREINRICFNALLLGCASGQRVIGSDVIDEVASDLDLANGSQQHRPSSPKRHQSVVTRFPSSSQPQDRAVTRPKQPVTGPTKAPTSRVLKTIKSTAPWIGALAAVLGLFGWASIQRISNTKVPQLIVTSIPPPALDSNAAVERVPPNEIRASTRRKSAIAGSAQPGDSAVPLPTDEPSGTPTTAERKSSDTGTAVKLRASPLKITSAVPPLPPPQIATRGAEANDVALTSLFRSIFDNSDHAAALSVPTAKPSIAAVPPVKVSGANPVYPAAAKLLRLSGDVVMRVVITKDGDVQSVKVVSGDAALARASLDAVRLWKFRPAYVNGHAESAETRVVVRFSLQDR
jgi:TonB family protein